MLFMAAGRPPLAGIAAAFAGVSAGFSANLVITPLDAILAGLSTEAVGLVADGYQVGIAGNYYFTLVSTLLLSLVGAWVTEWLVLPWLARRTESVSEGPLETLPSLTPGERRGLWAVLLWTLVAAGLLGAGLAPEAGLLRYPSAEGGYGGLLTSAAMQGIVVIIALYAAVAGWLFGRVSGAYRRSSQVIEGMESAMATMASYLVLMFFAAQFVNFFAWSQLGSIVAVGGANLLRGLEIAPSVLLLIFVLMAALINLFVGSASAKWALLAPVFVPMFYLLGISPEATQMAYRIGDSATNIITPLMPYFGVVVAFAQRYQKDLGIGTLLAMMLPYSLIFLLSWSGLLLIWIWLGWPLGPGAGILL
jgi:aminobenzoyl-glutamate transport protein